VEVDQLHVTDAAQQQRERAQGGQLRGVGCPNEVEQHTHVDHHA